MAKLPDVIVTDFSGGLVTNKSDYELNKNEFPKVVNFTVDNRGRLTKRGGFYATTAAISNINHAFTYQYDDARGFKRMFLLFDKGANSNMYRIFSTSLTANLSPGDTSASVVSNSDFAAATSTFQVEGDNITYTAKPSGTSFTVTAASILKKHLSGKLVTQKSAAVATGIDSRAGIYTASLNNRVYVTGRTASGNVTDGASVALIGGAAGSDSDTPAGLFATTYRDRCYVAGSGDADAAGLRNGSPIRVAFSDIGDTATWGNYLVNFFDVEDDIREMITGLRGFAGRLLIFKLNSSSYYNETNLKKFGGAVGAYNHFCTQEISNLLYTVCPSGVYVGNGSTWKKISDPIEKYLDAFVPAYDTTYKRVIENIFTASYDKKLYIRLGTLYFPDSDQRTETMNDVVLVYDTIKHNWSVLDYSSTVVSGWDMFFSPTGYYMGDVWQGGDAMFGSDGDCFFRLFNDKAGGGSTSYIPRGSNIQSDRILDSAGSSIPAELETKFYDINPSFTKNAKQLRVMVESGNFSFFYRLDKGDYITDWMPVGNFHDPNSVVKLSDSNGKRIAFKITNNDSAQSSILNGFVLEDIEVKGKL